jgi:DNA-binding NarL/FixJ family response regulator
MQPYTIVLVARTPIMRAGIRALLADVSDMAILGEAVDCPSLATLLTQQAPSVVLICLDHDQDSLGVELILLSKTVQPSSKVLLLAQDQSPEVIRSYLTAGTDGYLPFGLEQTALAKVIRDVTQYGLVLSEQVVQVVRTPLLAEAPPLLTLLSAREQEVLQEVANGRTNLEIADALTISADTVRTHLKHIYDKLDISSRPALIRFAMQAGRADARERQVSRG